MTIRDHRERPEDNGGEGADGSGRDQKRRGPRPEYHGGERPVHHGT
ncbi:hypothetical protein [Escherichia coli]